jgi:hypothetical protein
MAFFHVTRLWQEQARDIDISKGNAKMRNLAERIYEMLGKVKKSTVATGTQALPKTRYIPHYRSEHIWSSQKIK